MPLSEDAKRELKEAIRIVREDSFEKHARGVLSGYAPKAPQGDPGKTDPPTDPNDPPKADPGQGDPPKPKKSGYWGELLDE